jgi:hypothetical protein
MDIKIKEVVDKKALKDFVCFPLFLYKMTIFMLLL